jgi:branched-chain amino acid transport system substrate-binding protein
MHVSGRVRAAVALTAVVGLAAAACGDDDSKSSASTTASTAATTTKASTASSTASSAASTATTAAGGSSTTAGGGSGYCPNKRDDSLDTTEGKGAGWLAWVLECSKTKPIKAAGDPVVIGFQNPEGDPAGTFPEYQKTAKAAVDFINNELGGVGADWTTGKPGRPVKLEVCVMAINPADSTKCANELASKKPFAVFSSLNFFGNHFPIYQAAKIPVFVGTPITVADFTGQGVFAIGDGGGCVGAHTAAIEWATLGLNKKRVAVPWADTPPGVVCYYDLEKKPLDVLSGKVKADAVENGKIPDLAQIGVPIKPGQADITPQAQQVLDFKPEVIVFSAQGSDCWNLVAALGKLGWSPDKIPMVMTGSCIDLDKMKAAGALAKGIYFIGTRAFGADPANIAQLQGFQKVVAQFYVDKTAQYGAKDEATKGFGASGFKGLMLMYHLLNDHAANMGGADKLDPAKFTDEVKNTDGHYSYGGSPLACKQAPPPYVAVCNSNSNVNQWDGTTLKEVQKLPNSPRLVKGTQLVTGP